MAKSQPKKEKPKKEPSAKEIALALSQIAIALRVNNALLALQLGAAGIAIPKELYDATRTKKSS